MTRNQKLEEEKPKHYVQKFSNDQILAESILIGNTPFFLVAKDGKVLTQDHIPFEHKILKPLEPLSYVNKPYVFNSDNELNAHLKKVVPDTLDSLYRKVKAIWKKYVDADDFHLSICAADTIFSYFQDKIGLTTLLVFCRKSRFW